MTLNEYQNAAQRTQRGDLTRYERMHHALFGMARFRRNEHWDGGRENE